MWTNSSSKIYPGLRKEDVWRLWTDVNGWVTWHRDLEYCRMNEPFAVGAHFLLKPNGAPEFNIEIVDVVDGRKFT
ncbi:MAG TPA: polyketide cyclase, partial [bacterium]|nr:polyketide cyclase [bacterium]